MTIRLARAKDLPALTDIYNAAILETDATCYLTPRTLDERRSWWQAHEDPRFPIIVLEDQGSVVGYASLSAWMDGPIYARTAEASVFLFAQARGQGHGAALLRAILTEAARAGHHVVIARVWSSNAASLTMCRRCGFSDVGVQREVGWRRGVWEDCVILEYVVPD